MTNSRTTLFKPYTLIYSGHWFWHTDYLIPNPIQAINNKQVGCLLKKCLQNLLYTQLRQKHEKQDNELCYVFLNML